MAICIPNSALSIGLCKRSGDHINFGSPSIDPCSDDAVLHGEGTFVCDDGYMNGNGNAWIFPSGTITGSGSSESSSASHIESDLTRFVVGKGGLSKHNPQIKWGFSQSSFVEPKGRTLGKFTELRGFAFNLSYTEADQKSIRTIKSPDTFAKYVLVVLHCDKAGYLPYARTAYYYFPQLIEENTGPIAFEALMSTRATLKTVPKPKKPFSGF